MNEESHWDNIASDYNKEIFDVFNSDRNGILPRYFRKLGNKAQHAIDFGCGTGKALPHISPLFKDVLAIDISSECLRMAKKRSFSNVSFKRMDLSKQNTRLQQVEFVFCCNVIMLPEIAKNEIMFRNIRKALLSDGTAWIVVPSLDSVLYSSWRLIDWYRKEGVSPKEIPGRSLVTLKEVKLIFFRDSCTLMAFRQSITPPRSWRSL